MNAKSDIMKQIEEFQKFPIINLEIIKEEDENDESKWSQYKSGSKMNNVKERQVIRSNENNEMMNLKRIKSFYQ